MAIRGDVAALTAPHCVPCSTWRDMCVPEEKRGGEDEQTKTYNSKRDGVSRQNKIEKNANRLVGIYQVEGGEDRGMSEEEEEEEEERINQCFTIFSFISP